MSCRLALGTVQFGLAYGISNQRGQVPIEEVARILARAAAAGIDTLDTSYSYGNSEQVLGAALERLDARLRVVTKYPVEADAEFGAPQAVWDESQRRLRGYPVYGYMLHNYHSFRERLERVAFLQELKAQGLVQRIGCSVYRPDELAEILDKQLPFELIQLPYSVLDQRFAALLPELKRRGVEVHVRSAFLQGLVFRAPDSLPPQFGAAVPSLLRLRAIAAQSGLPVATLCLGFALANPLLDRVLIGVESLANLEQNLSVLALAPQIEPWLPQLAELALEDETVLNPLLWNKA